MRSIPRYALPAVLVLLGLVLMSTGTRYSSLLLIAGAAAGVLTRTLLLREPYDPRRRRR
jgi:hypothetical protein